MQKNVEKKKALLYNIIKRLGEKRRWSDEDNKENLNCNIINRNFKYYILFKYVGSKGN